MIAPSFSPRFQTELDALFQWRRDVRHFRPDPVPQSTLDNLLRTANLAPSVGLSEPWRFILVTDPVRRQAVRANFDRSNADALTGQFGKRARTYSALKLAGLDDAPHHIAVFCDRDPIQGSGLGRKTIPDTILWSTVMAIHTFWLAAAAVGIGTGWVSILDPDAMHHDLDIPPEWQFVAYLCVGYPSSPANSPELEREGWEQRNPERRRWIER